VRAAYFHLSDRSQQKQSKAVGSVRSSMWVVQGYFHEDHHAAPGKTLSSRAARSIIQGRIQLSDDYSGVQSEMVYGKDGVCG